MSDKTINNSNHRNRGVEVLLYKRGKSLSPEHVEKISKAIKLRAQPHRLTFINGKTLIVDNITDWSKENGYRSSNLYQVKIGDKGRHKDIVKVELVN